MTDADLAELFAIYDEKVRREAEARTQLAARKNYELLSGAMKADVVKASEDVLAFAVQQVTLVRRAIYNDMQDHIKTRPMNGLEVVGG